MAQGGERRLGERHRAVRFCAAAAAFERARPRVEKHQRRGIDAALPAHDQIGQVARHRRQPHFQARLDQLFAPDPLVDEVERVEDQAQIFVGALLPRADGQCQLAEILREAHLPDVAAQLGENAQGARVADRIAVAPLVKGQQRIGQERRGGSFAAFDVLRRRVLEHLDGAGNERTNDADGIVGELVELGRFRALVTGRLCVDSGPDVCQRLSDSVAEPDDTSSRSQEIYAEPFRSLAPQEVAVLVLIVLRPM